MPTLLKYSTAPESYARTRELFDLLDDEWSRRCLDVWLRHWWGEVQYDLETCIATITPDVVYRWDGTERLGEPLNAHSRDFARTMYSEMFESHQTPGGPFDQERWAFGEWGLMMEAVFTSVMRADFVRDERPSAEPTALHLVQWPMTLIIPVDRESGLMSGEIMYAGAPLHVEPCDIAMTLKLLGRLS